MIDLKAIRLPGALVAVSGLVAAAALTVSATSQASIDPTASGAWVGNDAANSVTHIGPGGADATVGLDGPVGEITIVQRDGAAYALDEAGTLSLIDPVHLEVSTTMALPNGETEVLTGGGHLWALDRTHGSARELDPNMLSALGPAVQLGDGLGAAVVDDHGVLWVADDAGQVRSVQAGTVGEPTTVSDAGSDLMLSVVAGAVVAVDPVAKQAAVVSGPSRGTVYDLPATTNPYAVVPALVASGSALPLLDAAGGLGVLDTSDGGSWHTDLGVRGHQLGTPLVATARVYVPDFTAGTIVVVDLATMQVLDTITVTGTPGAFDVVVNGEVVYVNDPATERAWTIDATGRAAPTRKYDPDKGDGTLAGDPAPSVPDAPELPQADPPAQEPAADVPEQAPPTMTIPPVVTVPPPPSSGSGGPPPGDGSDADDGGPRAGTGDVPTDPDHGGTDTTVADGGEHPPESSTTTTTAPAPPVVTGDGAVRNLSASAGDASVSAAWEPPADWHDVTGYSVVATPGGTAEQVGPGTTSITLDDLHNGTAYQVQVTAISESGRGATVTSAVVTPAANIPDPPGNVGATPGDGVATITWSAPRGQVAGYRIDVVVAGSGERIATIDAAANASSAPVGGLANGTAYVADVSSLAANGATSPPARTAAFTPRGLPGAAPAVQAAGTASNQITVSWEAAPANGSAITAYVVSAPGTASVTAGPNDRQAIVNGLTNGQTYTFSVVARNAVGDGPASPAPPTTLQSFVPDAPGNVHASAGDGRATVTWDPANGNGTSVSYEVRNVTTGETRTVAGSPVDFGGLGNGTSYSFSVTSVGGNGARSQTIASGAVVPSGPPAAPSSVSIGAQDPDSIAVSITQQSPSNGTTVDSWRVTVNPGGSGGTFNSPSFTIDGLRPSTTYSVTVVAIGGNGLESGPTTSGQTTTDDGRPGDLTGLTADGGSTGNRCEPGNPGSASWNATPGATEYEVDNDGEVFRTSQTSISFPSGTGSITVTPISQWGVAGGSASATYRVYVTPEIPPGSQCP